MKKLKRGIASMIALAVLGVGLWAWIDTKGFGVVATTVFILLLLCWVIDTLIQWSVERKE